MRRAFASMPAPGPLFVATLTITLALVCSQAWAEPIRVLIAPQDSAVAVADLLQAQEGFEFEVTPLSYSLGLLDAETLEGFDVVVVWCNQTLTPVASQQAGDALADFVDGGGGVVEMAFAHYLPNNAIRGRWRNQPYASIGAVERTTIFTPGQLGQIDVPNHPIMDGIDTLSVNRFRTGDAELLSGAQRVASYDDGQILVATREDKAGRTAWLGIYPSAPGEITGDWQRMLAQAVGWAGQPLSLSAGGPYRIEEGTETLMLDASGSDTSIVEFAWDLDGDGEYDDAQGPTVEVDTLNLDGPGQYSYGLQVEDEEGRIGTATAVVSVSNVAPMFASGPPTSAPLAELYRYQPRIEDPGGDNDPITITLIEGPPGTMIEDGQLTWTSPPDALEQTFAFAIGIDDGDGGTAEQRWEVEVRNVDADMDGVQDAIDNCPGLANPDQADLDGDTIGDRCDTDADGDGLSRREEIVARSDDTDPDTDDDGLNDFDEVNVHGTEPSEADSDGDGIDDPDELERGTDPTNADSDNDGLNDGQEREFGTDPRQADSDRDDLADGVEVELGTDPTEPDSDGDGITDGAEIARGTNPLDPGNNQGGESNKPRSCQQTQGHLPQSPAPLAWLALAAGALLIGKRRRRPWR